MLFRSVRKIRAEKGTKQNDQKIKPWKLAKKSTLVLKIALTKIDSLVDEAKKIPDEKTRNQMISYFMDTRYKIHDMIDASLKVQKEKLRSAN